MEEKIPDEFRDKQEDLEKAALDHERAMANSEADHIAMSEGRVVGKEEREAMARARVRFDLARYHQMRTEKEYAEYEVKWEYTSVEHAAALKQALETATVEEDMQRTLATNSLIIAQHLVGNNARYVIPKPKLGTQLVPDFLIAEMSSIGIEWHAVELESTLARLCTASGQASAHLTHAIHQIMDWRTWLQSNLGYARTPKSSKGLGLIGITPELPAAVLIGRRIDFPERFNDYRRQVKDRQNIEVHTYDWLVEQVEFSAQRMGK